MDGHRGQIRPPRSVLNGAGIVSLLHNHRGQGEITWGRIWNLLTAPVKFRTQSPLMSVLRHRTKETRLLKSALGNHLAIEANFKGHRDLVNRKEERNG